MIPKDAKEGIINNQKQNWTFQFDKILHNVPQEEVFEYCVNDIIQSSAKGYNGTVFAYGQTGSGKTFSISGSPSNFNYRGIIPRAITRLFQEIGSKPEFEFIIRISYLEIYNEVMFDLLSPVPTHEQKGDITFQEDAKGNVNVKGLSKHTVTNEEEAFNLLFEGESNRTISEHQLNKSSTRSHCIFIIYLEMKSRIESTEKVMTAKLNFVDLAGSERVKKTGSTGLILKEATYINKSLTFLEQVVVALTEKNKKTKEYVPYRQSKLTHILKDSIGGNCKTVMVATIWPEEGYLQETLSTLNFAKRMKNVVNEATVNIQLDTNALLKKLSKEIKELKQELAMHNTLANRGRINYDSYSQEEQSIQQGISKKFLMGETEEMEFDSVRQAKELFYQIRNIYQKVSTLGAKRQNQIEEEIKRKKMQSELGSSQIQDDKDKELIDPNEEESKKDTLQLKEKFPIGRIPDKNIAFVIFKSESSYSQETELAMKTSSEELTKQKTEARKLLERSTTLKAQLDQLKSALNDKKQNKLNLADEMTNVIDDEECKLINDLKGVRLEYKEVVDKFNNAKKEIAQIKENLDLMKIKYVENFENWFLKKYGIRVEEHELRLSKAKYGINAEDEKEKEKVYDPDEEAYNNAKKKVQSIHRAKKIEKMQK